MALKIFTLNLGTNSTCMHGGTSIYWAKRNSGSLTGRKRVVAAVIFTHAGHELHLRHDWRDQKIGGTDFPKHRTFFILKGERDDTSPGQPEEQVKDKCEVQSNDGPNSVHSPMEGRGRARIVRPSAGRRDGSGSPGTGRRLRMVNLVRYKSLERA